jgi:glycosyltransferase involved in cell wall biosynthesis
MLSRTPVIASNAGGAREIVQHSVNGLVVPLDDQRALVSTIQQVLDDRQLADALAASGYQSALQRYNLDDRVADLNDVIERVARHP